MPNTPAAIGKGISTVYAPPAVDARQRGVAERMLAAVGAVVWVDDEALIDAGTAISGSGPAYFFLLVEALAEAGAALGLPRAAAERLARETPHSAPARFSPPAPKRPPHSAKPSPAPPARPKRRSKF